MLGSTGPQPPIQSPAWDRAIHLLRVFSILLLLLRLFLFQSTPVHTALSALLIILSSSAALPIGFHSSIKFSILAPIDTPTSSISIPFVTSCAAYFPCLLFRLPNRAGGRLGGRGRVAAVMHRCHHRLSSRMLHRFSHVCGRILRGVKNFLARTLLIDSGKIINPSISPTILML